VLVARAMFFPVTAGLSAGRAGAKALKPASMDCCKIPGEGRIPWRLQALSSDPATSE
jgi:hypothetical protein